MTEEVLEEVSTEPPTEEAPPEPKEEPKEESPPEPKEEAKPVAEEEPKARKKRGPPRDPKIQCPLCLRFYCGWRSQPGGHVCHPVKIPSSGREPDIPKPVEPKPEPKEEPESPEDPMARSMVVEPKEEPKLTYSDVVRYMARERMNRHERKKDRWNQQMFG